MEKDPEELFQVLISKVPFFCYFNRYPHRFNEIDEGIKLKLQEIGL